MDSDFTMAVNATFNSIVHEIQLSNLNFIVNMTPYAAYITLKKSTQVDKNGKPTSPSPPMVHLLEQALQEKYQANQEISQLKAALTVLEANNSELKKINKSLFEDLGVSNDNIVKLEHANESYKKKIQDMEKDNLKTLSDKKVILNKLSTVEKDLAESTILSENRIAALSKKIKSKEKEVYNLNTKFDNSSETISKLKSELSLIRTSKSKADKECKRLAERLKKMEFRKEFKAVSVQTASSIDIPYCVQDPLPPIFSSQLCWKTKPIHLTNSVPNLTQLLWVSKTEDEMILEEAEQALGDLYDHQIASFYEEAKLKAAAARTCVNQT